MPILYPVALYASSNKGIGMDTRSFLSSFFDSTVGSILPSFGM
jgi:hypothetical protein